MDEISVKDLAVKTREAMRASGVAEYSLWKQYTSSLLPVVRWFRKRGHEMFSDLSFSWFCTINSVMTVVAMVTGFSIYSTIVLYNATFASGTICSNTRKPLLSLFYKNKQS
jgi:hypothetical protein